MKINPLKIGDLSARLPIIQGGMGIGISLSNLASAVTKAGGIGVISSAQIGFRENNFQTNPLKANLRALKNEIIKAKEKSNNGIIGVNIMVASTNYEKYIECAINSGADIIISGAGLPVDLPKFTKNSSIKIAPIVSSPKAAKIILKLWDKHSNTTADMLVIEGPKAGGHLGFKKENLESESENFDTTIKNIIKEVNIYSEKYSKHIPVIVAGGIFDGKDIAHYLNFGVDGVQMATRFVATEECDVSKEFKEAYVNCKKEDLKIVKSPVGMPGRAISNEFLNKTSSQNIKVNKCFNCISNCNPNDTPYCITRALINAAEGNVNEALIFAGENAYKIDKISTVENIMNELTTELLSL